MSVCTNYRVEVDGCTDGIKTIAVEIYAGLQGATGPSGIPSSIPGATGPSGPSGVQGIQGPSGDRGEQGATGPIGPSGAQGIQGVSGEPGERGQQGVSGIPGVSGVPGGVGATGATGPIPASAIVATQISRFTGDGFSTLFSPLVGYQTGDTNARYLVQLDGIEQDPDVTNGSYTIGTNQIAFAAPIPSGTRVIVRRLTVSLS